MRLFLRASRALPTFCTLAALLPVAPLATLAATRYVWQESPIPMPPYDSWLTAATNIQDAVDAADPGDTVLVSGGICDAGGYSLTPCRRQKASCCSLAFYVARQCEHQPPKNERTI